MKRKRFIIILSCVIFVFSLSGCSTFSDFFSSGKEKESENSIDKEENDNSKKEADNEDEKAVDNNALDEKAVDDNAVEENATDKNVEKEADNEADIEADKEVDIEANIEANIEADNETDYEDAVNDVPVNAVPDTEKDSVEEIEDNHTDKTSLAEVLSDGFSDRPDVFSMLRDMVLEVSEGKNTEEAELSAIRDFSSITASSTLKESVSHDASNLNDLDLSTCWCEGDKGLGINSSVTWMLKNGTCDIEEIVIYNGYLKSEDRYTKNARPSMLVFDFYDSNDDFISSIFVEPQDLKYESALNGYEVSFNRISNIRKIVMRIKGAYPGSQYEDTCISDIVFWGF